MATPQQMEKKRSKQIVEILAAVEGLAADIAAMKVELLRPEVVELEAPADRTGEILAAIGGAATETGSQLKRIIDVVSTVDAEMIALRSEIGIVRRMQETQNLAQVQAKPATGAKSKGKR